MIEGGRRLDVRRGRRETGDEESDWNGSVGLRTNRIRRAINNNADTTGNAGNAVRDRARAQRTNDVANKATSPARSAATAFGPTPAAKTNGAFSEPAPGAAIRPKVDAAFSEPDGKSPILPKSAPAATAADQPDVQPAAGVAKGTSTPPVAPPAAVPATDSSSVSASAPTPTPTSAAPATPAAPAPAPAIAPAASAPAAQATPTAVAKTSSSTTASVASSAGSISAGAVRPGEAGVRASSITAGTAATVAKPADGITPITPTA